MSVEQSPEVYLQSKGIKVFRANGAEATIHCLFCPDGDPKGKGKMYVNTETWLWDCKRCGESGNRRTLLRHFGDEDEIAYLPGQDPIKVRAVLEAATDLATQMLANNDDVLAYLMGPKRGLKASTVERYKIGYVPSSWSLEGSIAAAVADKTAAGILNANGKDFFRDKLVIPYLQRGSVVQMRAKDLNGKYFTPPGHPARLFNSDALAGAEDVIVTEGEFDCLILQQTLEMSTDPRVRGIAVVGVPGANALPAGFEHFFVEAKRVYVAFDPDDTGRKAAIKVKEILGSKARIVELPADLPKCDWTEYLTSRGKTLSDVLELLGTATGRRLWTVSDAGAKWRKRQTVAPGIKTGFSDLDGWFHPGIEPGDLVIPLAKTGVGKTNFLCTLAHNTRSRPMLMITMEMTAAQIYERLRRIHHFHFPYATDRDVEEAYSQLRIVDENRLGEGSIPALCDEYEAEMGQRAQLVSVDYLGYFAKGCKGVGQYEKTTNAVMTLKADAKLAEVGLIAPHQVNRMAEDGKPLESRDARDSGAVEETADLLISLFRPNDAIDGSKESVPSGAVRMGVLKNRKGGIGMHTTLRFSAASLLLVDDTSPAAQIVAEENRCIWRGMTYEEVRAYRTQHGLPRAQLSLVR